MDNPPMAGHHVPAVRLNTDGSYTYYVNHPQQNDQYLDWLSVVDENGEYVWWTYLKQPDMDYAADPPMEITFEVEGLHQSLKPYENCNIHGLWTNDDIDEKNGVVGLYVGPP